MISDWDGGEVQTVTRFVRAILVGIAVLTAGIGRAQYLEATLRVNYRPWGILWTPTSNKVYVSSPYDENVVIIDAATLQVRTALEMGDQPNSMCWNSVNNKLYVQPAQTIASSWLTATATR